MVGNGRRNVAAQRAPERRAGRQSYDRRKLDVPRNLDCARTDEAPPLQTSYGLPTLIADIGGVEPERIAELRSVVRPSAGDRQRGREPVSGLVSIRLVSSEIDCGITGLAVAVAD